MIVGITGRQGDGKTALMCAFTRRLWAEGGYSPAETFGNVAINVPGVSRMNNEQLRTYMAAMVREGQRHRVILMDEVDRVFPARFFADKGQTETLIGLWQDEKLFNYIFYTCHPGTSVDKIIRDSTQRWVYPKLDKAADILRYDVIDYLKLRRTQGAVLRASNLWTVEKFYDRWELVT
jgi:hypothetical protein